jgi:hypothetical protein
MRNVEPGLKPWQRGQRTPVQVDMVRGVNSPGVVNSMDFPGQHCEHVSRPNYAFTDYHRASLSEFGSWTVYNVELAPSDSNDHRPSLVFVRRAAHPYTI